MELVVKREKVGVLFFSHQLRRFLTLRTLSKRLGKTKSEQLKQISRRDAAITVLAAPRVNVRIADSSARGSNSNGNRRQAD